MTTTRRTLLGSAIAAAGAAAVPRLTLAQGIARAATINTKDGIELFVKDTGGAGRAVVLTHAWPLNADIWDYQAAALSRAGYRVISYDRRGFGRSGKPASGYTFDAFADDLAAVIDQTGVRDAAIVGYSMGGGEVIRYLTRHSSRNVVKAGNWPRSRCPRSSCTAPPIFRFHSNRPRQRLRASPARSSSLTRTDRTASSSRSATA